MKSNATSTKPQVQKITDEYSMEFIPVGNSLDPDEIAHKYVRDVLAKYEQLMHDEVAKVMADLHHVVTIKDIQTVQNESAQARDIAKRKIAKIL